MARRDDAIFVDHDSQLGYQLGKREWVLFGLMLVVLAVAGYVTRDIFAICFLIYLCASLLASLGLSWILGQAVRRHDAAIPPQPQLVMSLLAYLSAIALPLGTVALFITREVIADAGPQPDFSESLNTTAAFAAVLLPMVEILARIWGIRAAQARQAQSTGNVGALKHMAALEKLAYQDALTGLPNRRCFEEWLTQLSAGDQEFAVMFVDLDKFKPINDQHGHAVGDEFLKAMATRIASLVRSSDLVARLGGDEFAVLIKDADAQSVSRQLAERLTQAMKEPVFCTGVDLRSSASVGIATGKGGLDDVENVVHRADIAMYEAKRSGGACFHMAAA